MTGPRAWHLPPGFTPGEGEVAAPSPFVSPPPWSSFKDVNHVSCVTRSPPRSERPARSCEPESNEIAELVS